QSSCSTARFRSPREQRRQAYTLSRVQPSPVAQKPPSGPFREAHGSWSFNCYPRFEALLPHPLGGEGRGEGRVLPKKPLFSLSPWGERVGVRGESYRKSPSSPSPLGGEGRGEGRVLPKSRRRAGANR